MEYVIIFKKDSSTRNQFGNAALTCVTRVSYLQDSPEPCQLPWIQNLKSGKGKRQFPNSDHRTWSSQNPPPPSLAHIWEALILEKLLDLSFGSKVN